MQCIMSVWPGGIHFDWEAFVINGLTCKFVVVKLLKSPDNYRRKDICLDAHLSSLLLMI